MAKVVDMVGREFDGCLVLARAGSNKDKKATWLCECFCGDKFISSGKNIRSGAVKSCGCYRKKVMSEQGRKNKTHGETSSRLYYIWRDIKKRCRLETCEGYKNYGGRGIDVCDQWYDSFEEFMKWANANGYKPGLTIDREDNSKGYSPENCRWVDYICQANNRRGNVREVFNGKLLTNAEIARSVGISRQLLHYRKIHEIPYDKPKKRKGDD